MSAGGGRCIYLKNHNVYSASGVNCTYVLCTSTFFVCVIVGGGLAGFYGSTLGGDISQINAIFF